MGLVATMREIKDTPQDGLNRQSANRPMLVDGSLSELVTRALNLVHTKKNLTTGEPFYGKSKADGSPPPGAGGVPNFLNPDSPTAPTTKLVSPTLESQQQQQGDIEEVAAVLTGAISVNDRDSTKLLAEAPIMIYAIPEDKKISEEMNDNISMYADSGSVNVADFIFITSDSNDTVGDLDYRVIDASARIDSMIGEGAKTYPDIQAFMNDVHNLRRKR